MCDHPAVSYFTIHEVSERLHLSRSKVYDLIAREGLPAVHFGRAVRVSAVALSEWLARRDQAEMMALNPSSRLGLPAESYPRRHRLTRTARLRNHASFPNRS